MYNNSFLKQKIRLDAVFILRALKGKIKYSEISDRTGIPTPIISNYVNGKLTPSISKAEEILKLVNFKDVYRKVICDPNVNFNNPNIATFVSWHIVNKLCIGKVVNKVGVLSYRVYSIGLKVSEIIEQPLITMITGRGVKKVIGRRDRLLVIGEVYSDAKIQKARNMTSQLRAKITLLVFIRGRSLTSRDPKNLFVLCD